MERFSRFFSRLGLYRNVEEGWVTGVCAGIADRLGIKPFWIRILFAGITIISRSIAAVIAYLLLAFLMKSRASKDGAPSLAGVQMAYRDLAATVTVPPGSTAGQVHTLKARFSALDLRLNNLEAAVMTDELSLRRKFKDIGG
jgi:phage shock protein C